MPDELPKDESKSGLPKSEQTREIDVENAKGDELRKHDSLFNAAGGTTSANLDLGVSREFLYCEGYLKAARVLVNHSFSNEYDRHILIFPVAFLYRHHLELSLKDLIQTAHSLASGQPKNPKGHVLANLWEELKTMLGSLGESPKQNDLDAVESYIEQLERVDKAGQAFRYAASNEGTPHLSQFNALDVRVLSEAMERLAGYLSGISYRLNLLLDHKEEMLGYKQEFEQNS
jgi:hypothetical protein